MWNRKKTHSSKKNEGLEFSQNIQSKKFDYYQIFLLAGNEKYFINESSTKITKYFSRKLNPMDIKVIEASKKIQNELMNFYKYAPMAGSHSFLCVTKAEKLTSSFWKDFSQNRYHGFCAVFVFDEINKLFNSPFTDLFNKVIFTKLYGQNLIKWVKSYIRQKKRKIYANDIRALVDKVGSDLEVLSNELDKCCLIAESKIDSKVITEVIDFYATDEQKLIERIIDFDLGGALFILDDMSKFNLEKVTGLLRLKLDMMYKILTLSKSETSSEVAATLKMSTYQLSKQQEKLVKFSRVELLKLYELVTYLLNRRFYKKESEKNAFRRVLLQLHS